MSAADADSRARWADAEWAGDLFAVDPIGLGGVVLRAQPGPVRDRWLERLRVHLAPGTPLRRVPLGIPDDRFVGGLDLSSTLATGRPVVQRGVLAEAAGGVLVLPMAERWTAGNAARLGLVMDRGEVMLEREGLSDRIPTRFGVIALDEGLDADERPPASLSDRLALHVDLSGVGAFALEPGPGESGEEVLRARERLAGVRLGTEALRTLCDVARSLGVDSMRASVFAARAARVAAALEGRDEVSEDDVVRAARLILAPRAKRIPSADPESEGTRDAEPPPPADPPSEPERASGSEEEVDSGRSESFADPMPDRVLEAIAAAIPSDLLAQSSRDAALGSGGGVGGGRRGPRRSSRRRGRPIGVRPGDPGTGARLSLIETLRAAAPWQALRRQGALADRTPVALHVRRDDFRIRRFEDVVETTLVFAVDASGSTAFARLAETKGAIELLLAQSYARRDRVALIAFRGTSAEVLLPPTRSLVAAKRRLAALPGGGGTPLAAGFAAAQALAERVQSAGGAARILVLTDGEANVARDGTPGRERAMADAVRAARSIRAARLDVLLIDTSPRERAGARTLAAELGGGFLWLPRARSSEIAERVRRGEPDPQRSGILADRAPRRGG